MADGEQASKITPTPQRKPFHQNRGNYSYRGRGRPDPHVSRALHNLGVSDLREWLDKKHHQEEQPNKGSGPPPDPSYSYLKDPLRENTSTRPDERTRKYKENHEKISEPHSRGTANRGKRGGFNRDDRHFEEEKTSYIQNPVNIKVELLTATGERSYKVDEETKLADIKHIPDRNQQERRSFRAEKGGHEHWRGRGRDRSEFGRGRGETGRGRGDLGRGRGDFGRGRGDFGRGRGDFGRGRGDFRGGRGEFGGGRGIFGRGRGDLGRGRGVSGRGRGESGRGRGETGFGRTGRGRSGRGRGSRGYGQGDKNQGRHNSDWNSNQEQEQLALNLPPTEITTEENWDNECIDHNPTQIEGENVENKEQNVEESEETNPEEYYEEAEEFHEEYDEGGEYLETAEGYEDYSASTDESHPTEESEGITGALEENIVITSSLADTHEDGKRTVRFKLNEKEDKEPETSEKPSPQEKADAAELIPGESNKETGKEDESKTEDNIEKNVSPNKNAALEKGEHIKE